MALIGNGSVFAHGGTVSYVTDMEYSEECAAIDCTVLASGLKVYECGLPKRTVNVTVNGISAIEVGAAGAATVCTLYLCTPTGSIKMQCQYNDMTGSVDTAIKSSLSFVQTTA